MKKHHIAIGIAAGVLPAVYFLWFRPWQLRWGASDAELERSMPGDTVVQQPAFNATRAVTVHAPPERIFPWIRQIGMNRAGWYSYDLLDNLGRPSARTLIPEHQEIYPGQLIPISPDGKEGMLVQDFVVNSWILWQDAQANTTWFWGLYPGEENKTRLVTRIRMRYNWLSWEAPFNLLIEFGDIWMMRKCLLGIKERAENY